MYFVYILYSQTIDKYYIGYSQNPEKRLEYHNSDFNRIWTKRGKPWTQVKVIHFNTKTEALKAEKKIKKQKSRTFIQRIINEGWNAYSIYPDLMRKPIHFF